MYFTDRRSASILPRHRGEQIRGGGRRAVVRRQDAELPPRDLPAGRLDRCGDRRQEERNDERKRHDDEQHGTLTGAGDERGENRRDEGEPPAREEDDAGERRRRADPPLEEEREHRNRERRDREKEEEVEQGLPGEHDDSRRELSESDARPGFLFADERPRKPGGGREEQDDPEERAVDGRAGLFGHAERADRERDERECGRGEEENRSGGDAPTELLRGVLRADGPDAGGEPQSRRRFRHELRGSSSSTESAGGSSSTSVEASTTGPRSRAVATIRPTAPRPSESRPDIGSSKIKIGGSRRWANAIRSRCFIPVEKCSTGAPESPRPTAPSRARTSSRVAARPDARRKNARFSAAVSSG